MKKIYIVQSTNGKIYGAYTILKNAKAEAARIAENLYLSGSYDTAHVETLKIKDATE
jgi:hypothetical protein